MAERTIDDALFSSGHGSNRAHVSVMHSLLLTKLARPRRVGAIWVVWARGVAVSRLPTDRVVAESSQAMLDASLWEPYYREVKAYVVDGDHTTIMQPPKALHWLRKLGLIESSKL